MTKRIAVLGSTGSVGTQALQVVEANRDGLRLVGLAAATRVEELAEQVMHFDARVVSVATEEHARELERHLEGTDARIVWGREGLIQVALQDDVDVVLNAVVGAAGLAATWEAVRAGKDVALANKESLVMAGELIMATARETGALVLPVDSEPNALHQCLRGTDRRQVHRLILTASGGPFLGRSPEELSRVTPDEALDHPTWEMGPRITIDSATLMNKGFELIESRWLFDLPPDRIDVVIHPQSIVHSLVELVDGSLLAQAGPTDMRLPIQDALTYPERWEPSVPRLDLTASSPWTFLPAGDYPALRLARRALEIGGAAPAVLNAADEVAVEAFLDGSLSFDRITGLVEMVLEEISPEAADSIEAIRRADARGREIARSHL